MMTAKISLVTETKTLFQKRPWTGRFSRDRILSLLVVLPSVLAISIFVYGFIIWTAYVSLSNWNLSLRPNLSFVGLKNFQELFRYPRFQIDIQNTITFTVLFVGACLLVGLLLAVLLDQKIRGENLFRSIYLFPMAISFIVTGVAWRWLMNPTTGLNLIFDALGLDFLKSGWFTDPAIGIKAIVLAAFWQMSGFVIAMYLAGLRSIPEELREAAVVDGASELQVLRHIVLPLLQPVTLSAVIILGHISLKIYDLVVALSKKGPGFATDVPALFMIETTFQGLNFAQGASIAIILLLAVSLLVIPYLWYSVRSEARL